ncbi:unnamed protein product [Staurois parvus]|uniref:Uncharacterized protein n=1 Tax=Staurois parvus TaxID=386267 RepID=A0ABN9ANX3_9NEOB|nr:unnamed protein product [Staurois parvus]
MGNTRETYKGAIVPRSHVAPRGHIGPLSPHVCELCKYSAPGSVLGT